MKRIISFVLIAAMVLMAAGCSGTTDGTAAETTAAATQGETAAETVEETEAAASDMECDIVIVGAGGAGLTAALQAVENGAENVIIVEKMSMTGGNSVRSTGGMNAGCERVRRECRCRGYFAERS